MKFVSSTWISKSSCDLVGECLHLVPIQSKAALILTERCLYYGVHDFAQGFSRASSTEYWAGYQTKNRTSHIQVALCPRLKLRLGRIYVSGMRVYDFILSSLIELRRIRSSKLQHDELQAVDGSSRDTCLDASRVSQNERRVNFATSHDLLILVYNL